MDENEWWATSGPLLARVLDETAYPVAARPGHAYTFGLARVLDGLSTLIDPAETADDV